MLTADVMCPHKDAAQGGPGALSCLESQRPHEGSSLVRSAVQKHRKQEGVRKPDAHSGEGQKLQHARHSLREQNTEQGHSLQTQVLLTPTATQ